MQDETDEIIETSSNDTFEPLGVESDRAWGTRVSIGGLNYATSLFWQPLQNADDPYVEVEEASEGILEGADLFCIKKGKAPQFGICVSHEGYKNNEEVAAVRLVSSFSDVSSFVAVFKLKEGWWYTCVRNDIILSDGDMLFKNEEEAKEQFMSMLAVPDWGYKIAPTEWEIDDTTYPDIEDVFERGLTAKLQKIKALRGTKLLTIVGISAVVGLWLLYSIMDAIFLTPPKRPIIAPVAPKIIQPDLPPPEPKPWEKIKDPSQVMEQCLGGVLSLMKIMPPGWKMGNIVCNPSAILTDWTRDVGRISWLQKSLDQSGLTFSAKSISDNGNSAIVSLPFNNIKSIETPPTMNDYDLKVMLNNIFQSLGQTVTLTSFSYKSPQNNTYRSVKFTFNSNSNPLVWRDLLTKFSGLDITMIKYNVGNETWDYEGAIYVL
ncbi:MAG: type 4b pilus protein PilO2 [Alphaproteobacteria bacterium]|nr:type 4b pilus protein PilO2 [Alphaproteobacteria bacterium]